MIGDISRRGFFTAFTKSLAQKPIVRPAVPAVMHDEVSTEPRPSLTAIVQGRLCLSLTSFCSVCVERCPVPGAISTERGLPMVSADACTGCGICHEVCPAPRKAILMLPRRQKLPLSASPA
jgi:Pyruvate/2-oxoacid:ferredoxin oxidoreductase delta subunit